MTHLQRVQDITALGVYVRHRGDSHILCNDPETGMTFAVHSGEAIGAALDRAGARYQEAMKGSHGDGHRVHR